MTATIGTGTARYGQPAGRWVLFATVLGTGLVFIDATVVNIAVPSIGTDLHASAAVLQWTVNGYTLSLAALILLGGSLGDRFGRRRVFVIGVGWFALASLLCGVAPNVETLIAARVLQGVGGALLAPGALAILEASFRPVDRARAIGAWSGARRHRRCARPVPRRLARRDRDLAAGVPDQCAAGGDSRPRGAAARTGDPRHLCAGLLLTGAAIAFAAVPTTLTPQDSADTPVRTHCDVVGPPLHPKRRKPCAEGAPI